MDSARWERVQALFHGALELPEPERDAFLKSQCGDDEEIAAEVQAMLEEDSRGASLLDRGMSHVAVEMLGHAHPAAVPPGAFEPYRIKEMLGEGGMGVVYLAERHDLGSLVAIKLLRDAWLSPARRERFASEQRTLAQLNHPSIARLYDADTLDDGTPYFIMEYVEGVPLTEYCRGRMCSILERLQLFRAVCEAVQYAHGHAVIHRDLKPSNILVKPDGTVRLLDFGIAKQLDRAGGPVDQTRTGIRFMTPAYAAPEQIRSERVGVQTDVYSLGVILYELLAGQLPFDLSNRTPGEAESLILEHEPEKPSAVARRAAGTTGARPRFRSARDVSWADLDVLCATAMHRDVERRYRSVEALIRDIDHYLKNEPLEARPDTLRYTMGKFLTRNRRPVTTASLVFAAVVGLVVFFTVRLATARNEALAEAARTRRIQQFILNLFEGASPASRSRDKAAAPRDSLRVITLLDLGVQEAKSLGADPAMQSELYHTLGGIYQELGKLDQADSLLQSALDKRRVLFGSDHAQVAESLVDLGLLRSGQARGEEGERLVREGLQMSQRLLPRDHPDVARATTALGNVLRERGSSDLAIKTLEEAVRLESSSATATPDLAASLLSLANAHFDAGHYDDSESLNQRALKMYRQLYGDRHQHVADVLINLGAIKLELGRYAEAERFDRQALDIMQACYGQDNPETASAMTILARALIAENRHEESASLLQRSLAIKERAHGKVHPDVASTLNELGALAEQQGHYDTAESYYRRMADIYRKVYGEHAYLGTALSNLASVYMRREEYARAEPLFRDAVRIYSEKLGPDHDNTGIGRIKLGRTLLRQHRYAEAEAETRRGREILMKVGLDETSSFLVNARKDLIEEYEALNQPENAAKVRAEIAAIASKTNPSRQE